jgi:poly-gamma-glutamate synthase PgsB/CapB
MPVDGVCVTAEKERLPILRQEADKRRCRLVAVDPESITDEEMRQFGWITFKENVAIALAVADMLGVDRDSALQGMWDAPPDPGVLSVARVRQGTKRIAFANVFAANDPESTLMNIRQLESQRLIGRPLAMLINCRPDRVERNGQMGALTGEVDPDRIILIGEPARSAKATVPEKFQSRVVDLGGKLPPERLLEEVLLAVPDRASVVAVGNIHGQGEVLLHELDALPGWTAGETHDAHDAGLPGPRKTGILR